MSQQTSEQSRIAEERAARVARYQAEQQRLTEEQEQRRLEDRASGVVTIQMPAGGPFRGMVHQGLCYFDKYHTRGPISSNHRNPELAPRKSALKAVSVYMGYVEAAQNWHGYRMPPSHPSGSRRRAHVDDDEAGPSQPDTAPRKRARTALPEFTTELPGSGMPPSLRGTKRQRDSETDREASSSGGAQSLGSRWELDDLVGIRPAPSPPQRTLPRKVRFDLRLDSRPTQGPAVSTEQKAVTAMEQSPVVACPAPLAPTPEPVEDGSSDEKDEEEVISILFPSTASPSSDARSEVDSLRPSPSEEASREAHAQSTQVSPPVAPQPGQEEVTESVDAQLDRVSKLPGWRQWQQDAYGGRSGRRSRR